MKLLVLSDSHGDTGLMRQVVQKFNGIASCILFLGDYARDSKALKFDGPIYVVLGNCDFVPEHPREQLLNLGGKTIWMCHGDRFGVKAGYDRITAAAAQRNADICLFGHTHAPTSFVKNGILFLNPGSISEPRGLKWKSYAVIEIVGEDVLPNIIEI